MGNKEFLNTDVVDIDVNISEQADDFDESVECQDDYEENLEEVTYDDNEPIKPYYNSKVVAIAGTLLAVLFCAAVFGFCSALVG